MDIHYTKGRITNALSLLALDPGDLSSRVPKACGELMTASYRQGFEREFSRIAEIMKAVSYGGWGNVLESEIREIAVIIWRLAERITQ